MLARFGFQFKSFFILLFAASTPGAKNTKQKFILQKFYCMNAIERGTGVCKLQKEAEKNCSEKKRTSEWVEKNWSRCALNTAHDAKYLQFDFYVYVLCAL